MMGVTRSRNSIENVWGERTPFRGEGAWLSYENHAIIEPLLERYGQAEPDAQPEKLLAALTSTARTGAFGLLRDLHSLVVLATDLQVALTVLEKTANGLVDKDLKEACALMKDHTVRQDSLLKTKIKHVAPHTLIVPQ